MWLLYVDKMFWHSCQFHLFFKCTKNSLLIVCWRLQFCFLFFLSDTFSWTLWNCGVGFVYTVRFFPLFVMVFLGSLCSSLICFFPLFSFILPSTPIPFFLSLIESHWIMFSVVQASCRYEGNFSERDLLWVI